MPATRLLFFNLAVKFDFIKLRDAADWWIPDVSLSAQTNEPARDIRLDKVEGRC
jgi:hypothetical protein